MPKKIDPESRARTVGLVTGHQQEYTSLSAAAAAVDKRLGLSQETVSRRVIQAEVDTGGRGTQSSEELAEIRVLMAKGAAVKRTT